MTERIETAGHESMSHETLGLLLGLAGVVIFGGTLPFTKLALTGFAPAFVCFGRAAIASVAAAAVLTVFGKRLQRQHTVMLFVAGLLLVFGFPLMSTIAMQTVPAAHGAVVLAILPLTTSIFAALIGGERPSALFWLCGLVGAALVVFFALRDSGMSLSSGDVWLFMAGVAASLGYVISGKVARHMPGWEVICWALILTAPISIVGSVILVHRDYLHVPAAAVVGLAYLSFGSMFLGFFAWNVGLAMGGIARVSQVQLLQAFVTIAVSALMLHEVVTTDTVLFAVAVMAIVALGRKTRVTRG